MKEFIDTLISRLEESKKVLEEASFKEMAINGHTLDFENYNGGIGAVKYCITLVKHLADEYNKKYEPTVDLIEYGIDGYNLHLKEQYKKGYEDAIRDFATHNNQVVKWCSKCKHEIPSYLNTDVCDLCGSKFDIIGG